MVAEPTLDLESELLERYSVVIGMDEVGRGAMAGPVAVGACALTPGCVAAGMPVGLRDSKLLSEKRREALEPVVAEWVAEGAVGLAEPAEIDRNGIIRALGAAARRALIRLHEAGADVAGSVVLLDGSFDYLTPALQVPVPVVTRVKGDRDCASMAAASVLAKVHRDALMRAASIAYPEYGWDRNKGYGAAAHMAAIAEHGATSEHRLTWLKGVATAAAP